MSKLWKKRVELNSEIEAFTVGDDYILDRRLVIPDCFASIAHAKMLSKIGILKEEEFRALKEELVKIVEDSRAGRFIVELQDEDSHTAIENRLVERLGEYGKKIHTGRSRNDQVIAAIRIYARDFMLELGEAILNLAEGLFGFAERYKNIPMPGRTHMQIAMPSSLGLWASSFGEELLDDLALLMDAYRLNNISPLGSAASYGVPIPLDREMVAELLGFDRVQNNVLYVNNSRGKFESIILNAVEQVMLTLSKLAQDIILFSMPEFAYFNLPEELCPGSSIMPQKKNPGMLELIRAKTSTVSALNMQIKGIIKALPSGYNRDFQETKRAFMEGLDVGLSSVRIMSLTIEKLGINEENLVKGFRPEIFATDRAFELVSEGMSFRDAYREVGLNLETLNEMDPYEAIENRTSTGTSGRLNLSLGLSILARQREEISAEKNRIDAVLRRLADI